MFILSYLCGVIQLHVEREKSKQQSGIKLRVTGWHQLLYIVSIKIHDYACMAVIHSIVRKQKKKYSICVKVTYDEGI